MENKNEKNTETQAPSSEAEKESEKKPSAVAAWFSARKKRLIPLILVALSVPFMLCIAVPFDIFAHNRKEFVFVWADFIPACLLVTFLVTLVLSIFLFVLPKKAYRVASFTLTAIAFMFFVQGTFLNTGLSSLAGDAAQGSEVLSGKNIFIMVLNGFIWLAVIAVMVVLSLLPDKKGYKRIVSYVMLAIVFVTQFANIAVLSISDTDIYLSNAKKEAKLGKYHALSSKNLTTVSSAGNVYYFLIDRFDEKYAEDAYAQNNELFAEWEDFTWFHDCLSLYANTYPSVAYMLTNRPYEAEKKHDEFLSKVYYGDDLPLAELSRNGYRINLFTQSYYAYNYNGKCFPDYVDNFTKGTYKAEKKVELFGRMMKMSLFRAVPNYFKLMAAGNIDSSTCNRCVSFYGDDGYPLHDSDNKALYNRVNSVPFAQDEQKQFSFVHLDGCHSVRYTDTFEEVTKAQQGNIAYSVITSVKIINVFLKELKERGLYDDATIIITGDHPGLEINREGPLTTACRTALFVKERGNRGGGSLKQSSAQVCHDDIWPTIMKSEGIASPFAQKEGVFDVPEGRDRARLFINHTYMRGNLTEYYYDVTGAGADFANWKLDESRTKHFNRHIME